MELLEKAEELLQALKDKYEELNKLHELLLQFEDYNETVESLFEKEFSLLLDMSSIYEDLTMYLENLEQDPGMRFVVNRLRKECDKYVLVEVIYDPEDYEYE